MPRVTSHKTRQAILEQGVELEQDATVPDKLQIYNAAGEPLFINDAGPAGPEGPAGPAGPAGEDGEDGSGAGPMTDAQYRAMILEDLPAHYWPLRDEATPAQDFVTASAITLDYASSPSYRQPGPFGDDSYSVEFGGDGDYASRAGQQFLPTNKVWDWTMEGWFRNAADTDDAGMIFMVGSSSTGMRFGQSGGAGDMTTVGKSLIGLVPGHAYVQPKMLLFPRPAWHHLALVIHAGVQESAGNVGLEFWVDGRRTIVNAATGPGALVANGQNVQIGDAILAGRFAHFALYNRTLPATRLMAHAAALRPG